MFRKNIFDSQSEKEVFRDLDSMWSDYVMISHHIPVINVFAYEMLKNNPNISPKELDYLLKTSFDFVVASKEDEDYGMPLLIIEFDGVGGGYRSEEGYILEYSNDISYRKLKMDCKIKLCELMKMPFVIVSYPEVEKVERKITILDGIIGQVLSSQAFVQELRRQLTEKHEELLSMPPIERQSYFEWIHCDVSVATEIKYDPILRSIYKMSNELSKKKIEFNLIWHFGNHEEKDGYQIYQGLAQLDKKFSYLLSDQLDIFDGTEEINASDSILDRLAKLSAKSARRPSVLIRKKVKIRSLYCKDIYIPKLAEDLAHFLILSDITERAKSMNLL